MALLEPSASSLHTAPPRGQDRAPAAPLAVLKAAGPPARTALAIQIASELPRGTKQEAFPLEETMWTRIEYREWALTLGPDSRPLQPCPHTQNLTGRVSEAPSAEEQRFIGPRLPYVC